MEDSGLEVMAIIVAPLFLSILKSEFNSVVSPLFPIDRTTSSLPTIPTSPCSASLGCKNVAGVPVLRRVAPIFVAMIPDLPAPVT